MKESTAAKLVCIIFVIVFILIGSGVYYAWKLRKEAFAPPIITKTENVGNIKHVKYVNGNIKYGAVTQITTDKYFVSIDGAISMPLNVNGFINTSKKNKRYFSYGKSKQLYRMD